MKNRRPVGAEPYAPKTMKAITGGGKGRTTPVTAACMSRSWKAEVCRFFSKKSLEEMINQQSAAIRSTSSTKQHQLICQLRTNTRPLALDRQTITATESGTTATTKHAILLSTYHHLRVAQLTNRRRNLYKIHPSRPRGRSHAKCCCVAFPGAVIVITTTSSSFSHACACLVYIHVCTCTYRN